MQVRYTVLAVVLIGIGSGLHGGAARTPSPEALQEAPEKDYKPGKDTMRDCCSPDGRFYKALCVNRLQQNEVWKEQGALQKYAAVQGSISSNKAQHPKCWRQ